MSSYFLRSNVYACTTDDGLLFLDLDKEKYHGIGAQDARLLCRLLLVSPAPLNEEPAETAERALAIATTLEERQLLTRDSSTGKPLCPITLPRSRSIAFMGRLDIPDSLSLVNALRFLRACLRAAFMFRWASLRLTIGIVERRSERCRAKAVQPSEEYLSQVVRGFRRMGPLLYTAKGACLFDSMALVEYLKYFNIYPTWVFGIRTRPFGAHSWVQYEALVLNDNVEAARDFSPIVAVGAQVAR